MIAVWIAVLSLPYLASSAPTNRDALLFLSAWGDEVIRPEGPHTTVTQKMKKSDDKRSPHIVFAQVKEIVPNACDLIRLGSPAEPGPRVEVLSVLAACDWLEESAINFLTRYGVAVNNKTVDAAPKGMEKYGGKTTYTQVDALLPWVCGKAIDDSYQGLAENNLFTIRFACNFLASKVNGYREYSLTTVVRLLERIADIIDHGGDQASLDQFIDNNRMITLDQAKPYVDEIWKTVNSQGHHDAIGTHKIGSIMTACRYLYEHYYHSH